MNNKNLLIAYKRYIKKEALCESFYGVLLAIISFSLFLYVDIYVYGYPSIITNARILLIIFYVGYFLFYQYVKNTKHHLLLRRFYLLLVMITLGFADLLNIVIYTQDPSLFSQTLQVTLAITVGCAIFAGLIRDVFTQVLMVNFILLMSVVIALNGLSKEVVYDFYNFAFYTVAIGLFNYYYQKSHYAEFVSKETLKLKLIELEGELIAKEDVQKALHRIVRYDELTGFYSRAEGLKLLKEAFENIMISNRVLSICYMDLDGLKAVNDYYGHTTGDAYIMDFAKAVHDGIRSTDICFRAGGDEFVLVLPDVTADNMDHIWHTILKNIKSINIKNHQPYRINCSHGTAEAVAGRFKSVEEMLELADKKMYEEKLLKKEKLNSATNSSILESELEELEA